MAAYFQYQAYRKRIVYMLRLYPTSERVTSKKWRTTIVDAEKVEATKTIPNEHRAKEEKKVIPDNNHNNKSAHNAIDTATMIRLMWAHIMKKIRSNRNETKQNKKHIHNQMAKLLISLVDSLTSIYYPDNGEKKKNQIERSFSNNNKSGKEKLHYVEGNSAWTRKLYEILCDQ